MITKWFKNVMSAQYFGGVLQGSGSSGYAYNKPVKDRSNTTYYASHDLKVSTTMGFSTTTSGVIIGTGNTAATDEDIDLESQILSGITASSPVVTKGMNGTKCFIKLRYVLTNTTNADIVVKEVGLRGTAQVAASAGATTTSSKYLLYDRTVLASSLTVPASSSAALEYTIESDWDLS